MRRIAITLLAGAGALLSVSAANASDDVYITSEYTNSGLLQPVRMVCDEDGNCYRTRKRVIIRDSYNYAPRERYIERRHYRDRDEPRAGVGIHAPGVERRSATSVSR